MLRKKYKVIFNGKIKLEFGKRSLLVEKGEILELTQAEYIMHKPHLIPVMEEICEKCNLKIKDCKCNIPKELIKKEEIVEQVKQELIEQFKEESKIKELKEDKCDKCNEILSECKCNEIVEEPKIEEIKEEVVEEKPKKKRGRKKKVKKEDK